jgi:uncharacterized protein
MITRTTEGNRADRLRGAAGGAAKRPRLGWSAAALATVLVAGATTTIGVRSYVRAVAMLHEERTPVPRDALARARADIPGIEEMAMKTSDGLTLRGWFAPGPTHGVVIFTHGGGANRTQLYPEARLLFRHGYGFLLYDSRASGESDGDLHTRGDREQRDVEAALDYVSSRTDVDRDRIALLGFSIGASSVAMAAANDERARAVILCAIWTSLEDEMKTNLGKYGPLSWGPTLLALHHYGVDVDNVRPIDRIAAIQPRPLLFVSGTRDGDTPLSITERVFASAGEPKQLWVLQGWGHGDYLAAGPAEYEARVVAFLDRALQAPGSAAAHEK